MITGTALNEMGFQPLPRLNGRRHLPVATGKYVVGTTDIMTKSNLLMRCFYPTKLRWGYVITNQQSTG